MNPQLFGLAQRGKSLAVTSQRRENAFYDIPAQGKADRAQWAIYCRPGLTGFAPAYSGQPCRGKRAVGGYQYAVYGATLYQIRSDGVAVPLGNLATSSGPVYMADCGTQLMLVDNPNGYIYQIFGASAATGQTSAQGLVQIASAGFLGAQHVTYLNNRFVVAVPGANPLANQQMQQSNLGDGTGWSGIAFDLADSDSDPLIAVKGYNNVLFAFGPQSTERWINAGTVPFTFNRIPAATQGYGLAAVGSIVECGDLGLAVLAQARNGQAVPQLLTPNGYLPDDGNFLADPDMVGAINAYATLTDAIGGTFESYKHRFYLLSFPTAQACWAFDLRTKLWSEWSSDTGAPGPATGVQGIFRGGLASQFAGHTLLSDVATGIEWILDDTAQADGGVPVLMRLTSQHLFQGDNVLILDSVQLDMEEGTGLAAGQGAAPVALLEVSDDKGRTWSPPVAAEMGPMGDYTRRVLWQGPEIPLRSGRNLTVRVAFPDPVKRVVTGEAVKVREGLKRAS